MVFVGIGHAFEQAPIGPSDRDIIKTGTERRDAVAKELLNYEFVGFDGLGNTESIFQEPLRKLPTRMAGPDAEFAASQLQRKLVALLKCGLTVDADAYIAFRFPATDRVEFADGYRHRLRGYVENYIGVDLVKEEVQRALSRSYVSRKEEVYTLARTAYHFSQYDPFTGANRRPALDGVFPFYNLPMWQGVAKTSINIEFDRRDGVPSAGEVLGPNLRFGLVSYGFQPAEEPGLQEQLAKAGEATYAFFRFVVKTPEPHQGLPLAFGFYWNTTCRDWMPFLFGIGFSEPRHFHLTL